MSAKRTIELAYFAASSIVGLMQCWPLAYLWWEPAVVLGWCWVAVSGFAAFVFFRRERKFSINNIAALSSLSYCLYFLWLAIVLPYLQVYTTCGDDVQWWMSILYDSIFIATNIWLFFRLKFRQNRIADQAPVVSSLVDNG